jgi:hypothetical protein
MVSDSGGAMKEDGITKTEYGAMKEDGINMASTL